MKQYFLDGWFVGEPGNHELPVEIPMDWSDPKIVVTPKYDYDGEDFSYSCRIVVRAIDKVVLIRWINTSGVNIPFDYSIKK